MEQGKVKTLREDNGYGFIKREDGKDIFFHFSQLQDKQRGIKLDDSVSFEISQNNKGPCAVNIKIQ